MDRFKNVLVAITPGRIDPVALRSIGRFAETNQARLTLIDVVEALPGWRRSVNVEGRVIDVQDAIVDERRDQIRRYAEITGQADAEVIVTTGKPFVELIRHVLENDCDLLFVGEKRASHPRYSGLSPAVMQLLRKCPIPVWIVRPSREQREVVLALVDPDPTDPDRDSLNDLVVQLGVSMCRRQGSELHVAHAWHMVGESALTSGVFTAIPPGEYKAIRGELAGLRQAALDRLVQRHDVATVGAKVHLVAGSPDEVLPDLARDLGATLIVMGTVARTGLSGLIMGNTAETILRSVDCSVLALKPEGFETPVRAGRRHSTGTS